MSVFRLHPGPRGIIHDEDGSHFHLIPFLLEVRGQAQQIIERQRIAVLGENLRGILSLGDRHPAKGTRLVGGEINRRQFGSSTGRHQNHAGQQAETDGPRETGASSCAARAPARSSAMKSATPKR